MADEPLVGVIPHHRTCVRNQGGIAFAEPDQRVRVDYIAGNQTIHLKPVEVVA